MYQNSFFYYINNKEQFHDAHKNKSLKNKNKIESKNDVNVDFVVVFYYVMINKMSEKLICRECYKKFAFNNFLHIHFKSKSYRRNIIKFEELSKDKKIIYDLILTKESFIMRELKLIELITFFTFSNEMSFQF